MLDCWLDDYYEALLYSRAMHAVIVMPPFHNQNEYARGAIAIIIFGGGVMHTILLVYKNIYVLLLNKI